MNSELSTYLNILRVIGAVEVLLGHMCIWQTSCGFVSRLPYLGSDGVVAFFVLSGYVIAYTTDTKDHILRKFLVNRCARIYSVVAPALLLTVMFEFAGIALFPNSYNLSFDHYQTSKIWLYIPLWLSFSSELWTLNEPMLINSPFWSLCFEVWFYVFFGLSSFVRPPARLWAMLAVALIAGPKIALMAPLWYLGVLAYRAQKRITLGRTAARMLFCASVAAYCVIKFYTLDAWLTDAVNAALGDFPRAHLQMAWNVPGYLILAVCFAASIFAMRFAALRRLAVIASPVGFLASFTFTIYLVHMPALKFFTALGGETTGSMLLPAILTLVVIAALGLITERRIGPWRTAFALLFQTIATRATVPAKRS